MTVAVPVLSLLGLAPLLPGLGGVSPPHVHDRRRGEKIGRPGLRRLRPEGVAQQVQAVAAGSDKKHPRPAVLGAYLPRLGASPPDGEPVPTKLSVDSLSVLEGLRHVLDNQYPCSSQVADLSAPEEQAASTPAQPRPVPCPRQVLTGEAERDHVGPYMVEGGIVYVLELRGPGQCLARTFREGP